MAYPKNEKNEDTALLEITTNEDEIKDLKHKTEKHDHKNFLKSLKIDNEHYKKNYKSLKRSIIDYHRNFNKRWLDNN